VTAVFQTTAGSFTAELMTDTMPITTSNFIDLCQTGYYDGVHFHRVRLVANLFSPPSGAHCLPSESCSEWQQRQQHSPQLRALSRRRVLQRP
jgi:hypothetical protein